MLVVGIGMVPGYRLPGLGKFQLDRSEMKCESDEWQELTLMLRSVERLLDLSHASYW